MREMKITVEPFGFVSLLEAECTKELNEHGQMTLKGIIPQGKEEEYQKQAGQETWVSVKLTDETGEERVFFGGIMTEMEIENENQISILSMTVKSGSYLLDLVPHIRSFQKKSFTYTEILEGCLAKDGGKFIIMPENRDEPAGRFLMQYGETDWQFVKRLAGYAKTAVMPEYGAAGKKLYFGYREREKKPEITAESWRLIRCGEGARRAAYEIVSRDVYGLGDFVLFRNKIWVIGKVESRLEGHELKHTYSLYTKEGARQPEGNNPAIAGVSLKANVTDVEKARVKVRIQADENKDKAGYRWFDYATVYSTPDGVGWYCMPEIGDEVRLTFPDSEEGEAYVSSCVHLESEGRENPDEKSWKNRQGKEILFTPDALILRDNKGTSIEMKDGEGIVMKSARKIILQAAGDIRMDSQSGGIRIAASDKVSVSQGGASIEMDNTIRIGGGKIYMN